MDFAVDGCVAEYGIIGYCNIECPFEDPDNFGASLFSAVTHSPISKKGVMISTKFVGWNPSLRCSGETNIFSFCPAKVG